MAKTVERRSRLIFVLGGAASGKSDAALHLAVKEIGPAARRVFVATGEGLDDEMTAKIVRHRRARSSAWVTAEVPLELKAWVERHGRAYRVILVDCLTMWLSNHYGQGSKDRKILKEAQALLSALRRTATRVVLVANELGMGLVPGDPVSRRFRELAGAVNRLVAEEADEVHLVVSGLPVQLK